LGRPVAAQVHRDRTRFFPVTSRYRCRCRSRYRRVMRGVAGRVHRPPGACPFGGWVGWEQCPFAFFCDFCGHLPGIEARGAHAKNPVVATTAMRLVPASGSHPGLSSFLGQPWAWGLNAVGVGRGIRRVRAPGLQCVGLSGASRGRRTSSVWSWASSWAMEEGGDGVSPVELTFEADFRGGATKGAGSASFRRGSVGSAIGILAGCSLGRWQRHAMGIVRGRHGECSRRAVSSDGKSVLLRLSVIFAAMLLELRPEGLTRRREDAKGKRAWVCRSVKTLLAASDCWRSRRKGEGGNGVRSIHLTIDPGERQRRPAFQGCWVPSSRTCGCLGPLRRS